MPAPSAEEIKDVNARYHDAAAFERLLGSAIPSEVVPGFEPDPSIRPEPIRLRTGGAGGGRMPHRQAARPSPMAQKRPTRFGARNVRAGHAASGGASR